MKNSTMKKCVAFCIISVPLILLLTACKKTSFAKVEWEILENIPFLPLSAVIFVVIIVILGYFEIIPPSQEILDLLRLVYQKFGLIGVFIASFLEGIVYLGLYFPGSMIIVMSLLFSGGAKTEFLKIGLIVGLAFTITSILNYFLGAPFHIKNNLKKQIQKFFFFPCSTPTLFHFTSSTKDCKKLNPLKY